VVFAFLHLQSLDVIENGGASLPRAGTSIIRGALTPLDISALLTGQGGDPPLEHELRTEMASADRVDMLVSFIKWSGLRLLMPAFEELRLRRVPVRILSTSYMGASDPPALEWLARQPNVTVRLSYDTAGTRLHAKAYHFWRDSGYATAYIGSANLSHAAMTQGLEWTVKVTAQDMPHILDRFAAEFAAYWESREFESFDEAGFARFRAAIGRYRRPDSGGPRFFAEINARPFQQRILEALQAARQQGRTRNLVVAATGTGKTVVAALDYRDQVTARGEQPTLLFVVHRREILQQALDCFRSVLRDQNFGELLVDGQQPVEWRHVFASVQSLNRHRPWQALGAGHFDHLVVDEAHHGAAASYRPLFEQLQPRQLLGLTATPERMDGSSILPDFDNGMTAEIRLPEALADKLLCPFHYFGVADNVDLSGEAFWRNGRYASDALESVFTGDDIRARQRVDLVLQALHRYQPELERCAVSVSVPGSSTRTTWPSTSTPPGSPLPSSVGTRPERSATDICVPCAKANSTSCSRWTYSARASTSRRSTRCSSCALPRVSRSFCSNSDADCATRRARTA
jgi:HKD family nuclease